MAAPMTPETLMKVLKDEGLKVVGVKSWKTHNRNHKGAFGPINGVIMHHTVTKGTDSSVNICYNGHSSLPGPLCHGVIDKDGTVYLVSAGRANHAGLGDGDVLSAVVAEKKAPVDNEATTDGNARFYGFECVNMGNGRDPWPDVQVEAMVKAGAAICRHYGWKAASVIGHKEWQPGKVDPKGPAFDDMDAFRARIDARLKGKPSTPKPPTAPSKPTSKPSVSLSNVVAAARKDPAAAQGKTTHKADVLLIEKALVAEGLLASKWADGSYGTLTKAAYKRWQNRCGYFTADTADGIPGKTTLARLAARHGFTVKG